MHKSHDSSMHVVTQLKSWVKANVRPVPLKPCASFDGMSDSDRRRAQDDDRTKAASIIVDRHLDKTPAFTDFTSRLTDPKNPKRVQVALSAVRDVLHEIQQEEWARYVHPSNSRKRAKAAA